MQPDAEKRRGFFGFVLQGAATLSMRDEEGIVCIGR
jgi:hypothetical protein